MEPGEITFGAIGYVRHAAGRKIPKSWRSSDLAGEIVVAAEYTEGLANVAAGQRLMVVFEFHESDAFTKEFLTQRPGSAGGEERGVFSTLSPVRPNPVGVSIVEVASVSGNVLEVKKLDMRDGTPVIDLKPWRGDVAGAEQFGR